MLATAVLRTSLLQLRSGGSGDNTGRRYDGDENRNGRRQQVDAGAHLRVICSLKAAISVHPRAAASLKDPRPGLTYSGDCMRPRILVLRQRDV